MKEKLKIVKFKIFPKGSSYLEFNRGIDEGDDIEKAFRDYKAKTKDEPQGEENEK